MYKLAKFLAERTKDIEYIIDIGCGNGDKLRSVSKDLRLIGIDLGTNLRLFKKNFPNSLAIECDLETDFPNIPREILNKSIVICADVIEHLYNPTKLLRGLSHISHNSPFLLLSTPDRILNRGISHLGPPPNKAHVREWSKEELEKLLRQFKFNRFLSGYTVNNNVDLEKKTILIISGYLAFPRKLRKDNFRVLAFVPVYNEEDVIESTLAYLCEHNIDVLVIDNWSSDSSVKVVKDLQKKYKNIFFKRFPKRRSRYYLWKDILRYIEKIALRENQYDWFIKNDADEMFLSPWEGIDLFSSIQIVDAFGYDAIDATVVNYQYLENKTLRKFDVVNLDKKFFSFGLLPGYFQQINMWKRNASLVLADTGGHKAVKQGWIFPLKFLKLHYPLRSVEHAKRKIFHDRLPRFKREKNLYNWHIQYDNIDSAVPNLKSTYYSFKIDRTFFEKYLVERLSGIGIKESEEGKSKEMASNENAGECTECEKYRKESFILKSQLEKITSSKTYKVWQFYCSLRKRFINLLTQLFGFLR
ncbi:glycosyltransferase [Persephonella sp.]